MNQENNGEKELKDEVFEKRWAEIEVLINEYLTKVKAKSNGGGSLVEEIINLPYEKLKRLAHEECGEYSFILSQYAYFIQQEQNYHQSKLDWCNATLTYFSANYGEEAMKNNTYINREVREVKISKLAHSYMPVRTLNKMASTAQIMVTTLNSLSYRIGTMIECLHQIQQSKRFMRNG